MSNSRPIINSPVRSPTDTFGGKRPVIFDILGPDYQTSILPEDMRMVLHVNPRTMSFKYARQVERINTWGGWVEQHWGDAVNEIAFEGATGGFMRLFSGLSNTTNPSYGGTRRETIAYDKYLDMLALFYSNGSVYDRFGTITLQGIVKITFDGGTYLGWFNDMPITESAEKPYQFTFSANFTVHREEMRWRSTALANPTTSFNSNQTLPQGVPPLFDGEG
jgi:hypothetical protein